MKNSNNFFNAIEHFVRNVRELLLRFAAKVNNRFAVINIYFGYFSGNMHLAIGIELIESHTTGIALLGVGHSLLISIMFGLGALVGMFLLYGFDPRQEKTVIGSHGYSAEEISQTIVEAEAKISGIEHANKKINNRQFKQRIQTICTHNVPPPVMRCLL
jgi:hypothetical protein